MEDEQTPEWRRIAEALFPRRPLSTEDFTSKVMARLDNVPLPVTPPQPRWRAPAFALSLAAVAMVIGLEIDQPAPTNPTVETLLLANGTDEGEEAWSNVMEEL